MMKKKYQSGGGIYKGYPAPAKQPVIKQGGGPTRETIRQDKLAESRKAYESGSKRIKAGISAASNIPVVGKFAQAIGIGADLATGLAKTIRGESGVKKDFLQAAVGSAALANPFKGAGAGFKKAKAFLKTSEISSDVSDISEGSSTYKKGGKMPLKKKYQSGGKLKSEELGSNLKGGTFYTAKNGRVGRLTPNTGLRKDSGLNSSIDTTGYSKGRKSFDYMESHIGGTQKTAVTRERVLPIIENLKKGALRTEKFKGGGKMPLKKASGNGKGKRVKPV